MNKDKQPKADGASMYSLIVERRNWNETVFSKALLINIDTVRSYKAELHIEDNYTGSANDVCFQSVSHVQLTSDGSLSPPSSSKP